MAKLTTYQTTTSAVNQRMNCAVIVAAQLAAGAQASVGTGRYCAKNLNAPFAIASQTKNAVSRWLIVAQLASYFDNETAITEIYTTERKNR